MNKDNAPLYLPIVKALAEGKKIQCNFGKQHWKDVCEINFFEAPDEYRIKPEPRTFDVWRNEITKKVIAVEDGDHDKEKRFSEWERITVQEVI
jgi:hypothetical protein